MHSTQSRVCRARVDSLFFLNRPTADRAQPEGFSPSAVAQRSQGDRPVLYLVATSCGRWRIQATFGQLSARPPSEVPMLPNILVEIHRHLHRQAPDSCTGDNTDSITLLTRPRRLLQLFLLVIASLHGVSSDCTRCQILMVPSKRDPSRPVTGSRQSAPRRVWHWLGPRCQAECTAG